MSGSMKITVVGSARRATIVIPTGEPFSALLPDIARILAEPPEASGLTLVSRMGEELVLSASANEQNVPDGAVVRLVPVVDAPSPPEVSDIKETVTAELHHSSRRWNDTHRAAATGIAVGLASLMVTTFASMPSWLAVVIYGCSFVATVLLGRLTSIPHALVGAALGLGAVPQVTLWAGSYVSDIVPGPELPMGMIATWILLGAAGSARALIGAGIGIGGGVLWAGLSALGLAPAELAGVMALVIIATLGLLPSAALAVSGVTAVDDHAPVASGNAVDRVRAAYSLFGWGMYAIAGVAVFSLAALLASGNMYGNLLGIMLAVVLMTRTRNTPIASHAWALWGATFLGALGGVFVYYTWPAWVIPTGAACVIVAALVMGFWRPRTHMRVVLRRIGDLIEGLATLASVPLLLGVFGIFGHLLGATG